jgi:hypothetical protein
MRAAVVRRVTIAAARLDGCLLDPSSAPPVRRVSARRQLMHPSPAKMLATKIHVCRTRSFSPIWPTSA